MLKYERPDLEELELILEGSFLKDSTTIGKDPEEWEGDFND